MKKILLVVLMTITTAAFAQHGHFRHGHHHGGHWQRGHVSAWNWMVPAIIGGAIVYEASRQSPPPTVIIQQQSVDTNCSPWTETQNPDGTITRTRTCTK
jgi:hypothetical protein